MLVNLCRCVYDALRPFLIHVNHIEILTELCDLLIHEFLDEQATGNSGKLLLCVLANDQILLMMHAGQQSMY